MQSTDELPAVERCVGEFFAAPPLSARPATVLVAYSGGPDSTALAVALARHAGATGITLELAYLDHGMREGPERERELAFVQERAAAWGCPIHVERIPEGQLRRNAAAENRSIEDVCRRERYRFLHRVANAVCASWIAVAHTRDDQHETLIMRFLQGSGPGGLGGMPERSGSVIRPLLGVTREHVHAYLLERNEPYSIDSTNTDEAYLRNRIRHRVLPALREAIPGYEAGLSAVAGKMADVHSHLERQAEALLAPGDTHEPGIPVERYLAADAAVRSEAAYLLADRAGAASGARIPHRFIRTIAHLDGRKAIRGGTVAAGHGLEFRVDHGRLTARRRIVRPEEKGYLVVAIPEREYRLGDLLHFRVCQREAPVGDESAVWLPARTARQPLCVRSRRIGDTLSAPEGRKSVKKLFNDWNVPAYLRTIIPICEDRDGPFAVWGSPFGYPNRVAADRQCTDGEAASGGVLVFEWME